MKKFITVFILCVYIFSLSPVFAEVLKGSVQQSIERDLPSDTYTGEFKEIDSKEVIEMTVEQVIDSSI